MLYSTLPQSLKIYATEPSQDDIASGYMFRVIDEMETSRGVTWTAEIQKNGITCCRVENYGDGDSNHYSHNDETAYKMFADDAMTAYPNASESLDSFVQLIDIVSS